MAFAKIKKVSPEEIKTIKNNPLEPIELDWDPEPVINLLDPKQFHKHYQELAPTREEQKQHLKHDNNKGIMPEHVHNTDAGFDLRYLGKDAIKLEPHLCTCIDLKVTLEIPATTMIQLASKSSLAKKKSTSEEE
ncbi:hypothetical protein G9A89_018835 [Geosiphon pyriformis]|nr:hypothetical protein G9A89_018835 [Geosiphon pyriformis]